MVAITFMAMLFVVGLAVDAGQLFSARRTMQEAVDAAAFAGAVVLYQGGTSAQAVAAATADAQRNGFVDGVASTTVTVNSPPLSGLYASPPASAATAARYVEVIIVRQVQTTLVPAEAAFTQIRARGTGGAEPLNNGYAIIALDRNATPSAFNATSNATIHLTGGGILVDSSSATAATNLQTNPAAFTIATPAGVSPPYGVSISGGTSSIWPTGFPVTTAVPQQPDPFAGFLKPDPTGLPIFNSIPAGSPAGLSPGIYTVPLTSNGGQTIVLNPGIYILKAGWADAGLGSIVSASPTTTPACPTNCGVFIFNTNVNYPAAGGGCGNLSLSGNGVINLAAQTTGVYANFLLYQDPACTNPVTISGNGAFTASGTIYVPGASFTFNGNNATLTGSQLVAKTVNVQNGTVNISFDATTTAQPILPRLAE
ncbi:MAG: hypothetical protein NVS1B1_01710 [Candidatus Limnocylindrales bacterium]